MLIVSRSSHFSKNTSPSITAGSVARDSVSPALVYRHLTGTSVALQKLPNLKIKEFLPMSHAVALSKSCGTTGKLVYRLTAPKSHHKAGPWAAGTKILHLEVILPLLGVFVL